MNIELQTFYDYLKEKYGVQGTEKLHPIENILVSMQIKIPGFSVNDKKHYWSMYIEKFPNCFQLIVGENFPTPNCSWSRCFELKEYMDKENFPFIYFRPVQTMFFKKGFSFNNLRIFTTIIEDFFQEKAVLESAM